MNFLEAFKKITTQQQLMLKKLPVSEFIPQRRPMIMIDRIEGLVDGVVKTSMKVEACNIFVEDDKLSMEGLIENMMQSCAARMGCLGYLTDTPVKIGVVAEISNCNFSRLPHCGEQIVTEVFSLYEAFNLSAAQAIVRTGIEELASAKVKIVLGVE